MELKNHQIFSDEIARWIRSTQSSHLDAILERIIADRLAELKMCLDGVELKKKIEELDDLYFDLAEQGDQEKSNVYFRMARISSALQQHRARDLERSLYEFIHSHDPSRQGDILAVLQKTEQSTAHQRGSAACASAPRR